MTDGIRRVPVSDGELACVDVGDGPPVLLLHGFPTSSYLWRREVPLLASRMRVLAPDLLGYGDSTRPRDAAPSLVDHARSMAELMDVLGIGRAALVGHALGGGVAQLMALAGRAEALVLVDSVCFDAWPIEGVRMLQATPPGDATPELVEAIVRLTFDIGLEHHGLMGQDVTEAFVRPWREDPPSLFRAARAIDGVGLAGREEELGSLDVPAFVIWGEEDPFLSPALGERLGELLGATVALLPGCGHFVTEDAPRTIGPLIHEYLRSRYLREPHGHAPAGGPVPVFLERPPAGFDAPEGFEDDAGDAGTEGVTDG